MIHSQQDYLDIISVMKKMTWNVTTAGRAALEKMAEETLSVAQTPELRNEP